MFRGMAVLLVMAFAAAPAAGQTTVSGPPAFAVNTNDGHLAGYSASLPLKLDVGEGAADVVVRVTGAGTGEPVYGLNLGLARRQPWSGDVDRRLGMDVSWNGRDTLFNSSASQRLDFGVAPKTDLLDLSVNLNARSSSERLRDGTLGLTSSLTLSGRPRGALAFGAGMDGRETYGFSLLSPFGAPADLSYSITVTDDNRPADERLMLRLVKQRW